MLIRTCLAAVTLWLAYTPPSLAGAANAGGHATLDPVLVAKALQSLYGKDAKIRIDARSGHAAAIWQATPAAYAGLFPHIETSAEVISAVKLAAPFESNGTQEYLVLTASNPHSPKPLNSCHDCTAALGGVLLKNQGGDWTVDKKTWHIADLGVYGGLLDGQLIPIGTGNYAARFSIDDTSMGDTTSRVVIVGIVGDGLQELLDIPQAGDDTYGTCLAEEGEAKQQGTEFNGKLWCYSYTSVYEFVKAADADHFDLIVRYTGTAADSPAVQPGGLKITDISRVDTYKWDGKEYKLAGSVRNPAP
jgi:hypothetical protein